MSSPSQQCRGGCSACLKKRAFVLGLTTCPVLKFVENLGEDSELQLFGYCMFWVNLGFKWRFIWAFLTEEPKNCFWSRVLLRGGLHFRAFSFLCSLQDEWGHVQHLRAATIMSSLFCTKTSQVEGTGRHDMTWWWNLDGDETSCFVPSWNRATVPESPMGSDQ